jgi:hypothetical protein
MREKGSGEWRAIKEYSDIMFDEKEIVPQKISVPHLKDELIPDEDIYLKSKEVALYHEPYYPKLESLGSGFLYLTNKRLLFIRNNDNSIYSYAFEEIRGRSTERNTIFQIVLNNDVARFIMPNESCYKWELIYDHVRRKGGYKSEEK